MTQELETCYNITKRRRRTASAAERAARKAAEIVDRMLSGAESDVAAAISSAGLFDGVGPGDLAEAAAAAMLVFGTYKKGSAMGTNYYLRAKEPVRVVTYGPDGETVEERLSYSHPSLYDAVRTGAHGWQELRLSGLDNDGLHLCKISWGWVPLFERHPGTRLTCWKGVAECIRMPDFDVVNEYGDVVSVDRFEDIVLHHVDRYRECLMREQGWDRSPSSHTHFGDDADEGGYPVEWTDNQFC